MPLTLITVGKMKPGPWRELTQEYTKRLSGPLTIHEVEIRQKLPPALRKQQEGALIQQKIPPESMLIALDENGDSYTSKQFADKFVESLQTSSLCIVIGGAYGLSDEILNKARYKIAFGCMTWPHLMVRVMLLEQLYRAQQILHGHPYHKE
ncbi:MAG: 23S rRNA (pseudouridine(1915)-N(3))-methyltransferase RlmH [Pseudomonadota bacterium]